MVYLMAGFFRKPFFCLYQFQIFFLFCMVLISHCILYTPQMSNCSHWAMKWMIWIEFEISLTENASVWWKASYQWLLPVSRQVASLHSALVILLMHIPRSKLVCITLFMGPFPGHGCSIASRYKMPWVIPSEYRLSSSNWRGYCLQMERAVVRFGLSLHAFHAIDMWDSPMKECCHYLFSSVIGVILTIPRFIKLLAVTRALRSLMFYAREEVSCLFWHILIMIHWDIEYI